VFNNLLYRENLDVSGVGVNLKIGMIYRPLNWLRVGVSFHSPTWYNMAEDYYNELNTSFTFGNYNTTSPVGHFEYDLTTPWKLQGSVAFIVLKNAAIGVDYEFIDYSSISLRSSTSSFAASNAFIDTAYVASHNVRIGAEYRLESFRIRAGYQFQMNPLASSIPIDATAHHVSVGLGYHTKKWFTADIAYMISFTRGRDSMFRGFNIPQAEIGFVNHSIVITGAINF
jgi:long-subunit fatty acid transport protein